MQVVILDDYQQVALDLADWASLGSDVEVQAEPTHLADPSALAGRLANAEVAVLIRERAALGADVLDQCPNLKLIVTLGMRNPVIDLAAASKRNVVVAGTPMLGYPTAELAWGLILATARDIPAADAEVRAGGWQNGFLGFDLNGATLAVAGFGRLGKAVAQIGVAFEMRVLVHSRSVTPEGAASIGAIAASKEQLIAEADVLTLHLPLTPDTRGFLGAAEFAECRPGLRLVNTSRGQIVDNDALIGALTDGRVARAALDVFDREPLPADDPIRSAPNVVLTPHLGFVTAANYRQAFGYVVENIRAWRSGSPIRAINSAPS